MGKWTKEQHERFKATMAAKKAGGWTNTGKTKKAAKKKKSQRKTVVKRKAKVAKPGVYPKAFAKAAELNDAFMKHADRGDTAFRQWVMQTITQLVKLL